MSAYKAAPRHRGPLRPLSPVMDIRRRSMVPSWGPTCRGHQHRQSGQSCKVTGAGIPGRSWRCDQPYMRLVFGIGSARVPFKGSA